MACFLPLLFLSRSHVFLGFSSPGKLGNFEYELNVLLHGIILFIKIILFFGKIILIMAMVCWERYLR